MVVGLPYPNSKDPVLLEKLKYMERRMSTSTSTSTSINSASVPNAESPSDSSSIPDRDPLSTPFGREFYENLCMKAVNQSIGTSRFAQYS